MLAVTQLSGFGAGPGSDFSPTDISGIQAWYRSDLGVTGSSPVTAWADQSGNSRNLSEATNGPTLTAADINGKDALTFDGTNDKLATADFALAMPYHWFLVAKSITWADTDVFAYGDNDAASNTPAQVIQRNTTPNVVARATADTAAVSMTLGTYYVIDAFFNTGASVGFIRINNGTPSTGTLTSVSMDGLVLGARFNDRFGNVAIAEMIIYNAEVTGTDLTNLMSYFTTRYGVP